MQDQRRVVIDYVSPSVNGGEIYIKRVVNEIVNIKTYILADGHDVLGASVLYKHENEKNWHENRIHLVVNNEWEGAFQVGKQGFYSYKIDAWDYMLKALHTVFLTLDSQKTDVNALQNAELFERLTITDIPSQIIGWVGLDLFKKVETLAKRTAEMHIALGSEFEETAFTPTRFNGDYTVWLKNRMLYQFQNRLNTIENNLQKIGWFSFRISQ